MISTARRFIAAAAIIVAFATVAGAALIDVDEADDVCAPTDDPCTVFDRVVTVDGAVLDFGLRTVRVIGNGGFDIGGGELTVRCGEFEGLGKNLVNGKVDAGESAGSFTLEARGFCADDATLPCLNDVHCVTGTCTVGGAPVLIGGAIDLRGDEAELGIRARGDVVIDGEIDATDAEGGGEVFIDVLGGSITVNEPIRNDAGLYTCSIFMTTDISLDNNRRAVGASDIVINAPVTARAGDGGGSIWLLSAGDIVINDRIDASATGSPDGGYGGYVTLTAAGNVTVASRARVVANGAGSGDNADDGGYIEMQADGVVTVREKALIRARSGNGDADGGQLSLEAAVGVDLNATLDVAGRGKLASGGEAFIYSEGFVNLRGRTRFRGSGAAQGGDFLVQVSGPSIIAGRYQITSKDGRRGRFQVDSDGDVEFRGKLKLSGSSEFIPPSASPPLDIVGCNVTLLDGSRLQADVDSGTSRIAAREQLTIEAGSKMLADSSTGTNELAYRDAGQVPIVDGSISPAPVIVLDPTLVACP